MKIKWLFFITSLFIFSSLSAQNKNKLSFDFGYGLSSFAMNDLNENYIHNSIHDFTGVVFKEDIKKGYNSFFNLKYQPHQLFDFGIYGNYQSGNTSAPIKITFTDEYGRPLQSHYGDMIVKTQAIGIGLTTNWYVSHLLQFHESENKFLQRFRIATEFDAGVGFSRVQVDINYPTAPAYTSDTHNFKSQDFQGQVALKFEYDYLTHPLFASIGLKVGYQYFKTKTLKTPSGHDWVAYGDHPIHLDFSGAFASVYLGFGK